MKKIFKKEYNYVDGIYTFSHSDKGADRINTFYSVKPFPSYQKNEQIPEILSKGNSNYLAKEFKEFAGSKKTILEAGCGTGQLSSYLSIGNNNNIVSFDATDASLNELQKFIDKSGIKNITLVRGSILDEIFLENSFDMVWCSGVLHHTVNPYLGFKILCKYLKPGGYIVVGLYNKYSRLRTTIRRKIYNSISNEILKKNYINNFDPYLRKLSKNKIINSDKIESWITEQYEHPIESTHTFREVLKWFKDNNIEFLSSIPSIQKNSYCDKNVHNLFEKRKIKSNFQIRMIEIFSTFSVLGSEGGLFVMTGKKSK